MPRRHAPRSLVSLGSSRTQNRSCVGEDSVRGGTSPLPADSTAARSGAASRPAGRRQMATIGHLGLQRALRNHLVERRHEAIFAGTTQQIPAGLRSADLVTCYILGLTTGFGGAGYTSVSLSVAHNPDG